ncbi:MAG TPA: CarD family transcriptional regulator, partial [Dissulfurispiraceae bacterium]|nr:CarD family transcriptional regulator [Dissulfurispiraceae bacterium]
MTIQQYEHLDTPHQILGRHAADVFQRLDSSLTEQDGNIRRIYNLSIPHLAVLLLHTKERWLVIEDTAEHAERLCNDLQYLASACGMTQAGCYYFPPPANPEYIGERARIIHQLASDSTTSMVTSIEALHISFGAGGPFSLSKGLSVDRELVELMLSDFGYRKVNIVMEKGEYAERGWLFDIYPVTEDMPVRVELFGDEIDLIRTFDIETQRSIRKIKELTIYPAIESVIETENGSIDHEHSLIRFVNNNVYINSGLGIDDQDLSRLGRRPTKFSHLPVAGDGIDSGALPIAGLGILPEERRTAEDLADAPAFVNRKTVMVLPSTAQIERLKEVLAAKDIVAPVVENKVACSYEGIRCLTQGILSSGLHIPGLLLLTGREIFGEMPPYRTIRKSRVSRLLLTIDDLKPGDFVVHRDHGIGKFIGLQKEKIEDSEEDVITLEYAGGDRLYLPFQGIDKLRKYSAGEGHVPALDRIGGKRWQTAKQKVGKSVKEMAEKLLKLYAERKVSRGFIFSEDTPIHRE